MIAVAVCDDAPKITDSLKKSIEEYGALKQKEIRVLLYHSGEELLEKYVSEIDILFLDIQMPGIDGITAAEKLRQKDQKVLIIFLTSFIKYALDGYRVNASNYLVKPVSRKRLYLELDRWIGELEKKEEPFLAVRNDNGEYKVLLKTIRYIETYQRNLMIHTDTADLICYQKLKAVEEATTPYGFARSHASYLVNVFYVQTVEKGEMRLTTGEVLPIGRTRKKAFLEQLGRYWGGII